MAKRKNIVGSWAFLIGVLLAVVLGILGDVSGNWLIALVIIGLVIGLLNVADAEVGPFLMSGVVLIIASAFGGNALTSIAIVGTILSALLAVFVPATIVVAIKNVFSLARD